MSKHKIRSTAGIITDGHGTRTCDIRDEKVAEQNPLAVSLSLNNRSIYHQKLPEPIISRRVVPKDRIRYTETPFLLFPNSAILPICPETIINQENVE